MTPHFLKHELFSERAFSGAGSFLGVDELVLAVRKHFEVVRVVVALVAVYVMHHLSAPKPAANLHFSHDAMLKDVSLLGRLGVIRDEYAAVLPAFHHLQATADAIADFAASVAGRLRMLWHKGCAAYLADSLALLKASLPAMLKHAFAGAVPAAMREERLEGFFAVLALPVEKPRSIPLVHDSQFTRNEFA